MLASGHRAIQEESPGRPDVAFPATLDKLPLDDCGFVEDFHDAELPSVIESAAGDAGVVDSVVIAGLGGLLQQAVDEEHGAAGLQRRLHRSPEGVELCGRNVRK